MAYKGLVLFTAALFLALFSCELFFPPKNSIADVSALEFPKMGASDAPIQMLVFEDLRCSGCRDFHVHVLPEIKTRYIDKGYLQCSYVLLSFLEDSLPLAKTCLAVAEVKPEKFFAFVDAVYRQDLPENSRGEECLKGFSKEELAQIQQIREQKRIQEVLEEHDRFAEKTMKEDFGTPTVYIDGVEVKHLTVEALERTIRGRMRA